MLTCYTCAMAQVAAHAGSWKQLYFERNLEDALEQWVFGQRGWQERLRRMLGDGTSNCAAASDAMCCRQGLQDQNLGWQKQQRQPPSHGPLRCPLPWLFNLASSSGPRQH